MYGLLKITVNKMDSDATYCSEIESGTKVFSNENKYDNGATAIRRSQRISQKNSTPLIEVQECGLKSDHQKRRRTTRRTVGDSLATSYNVKQKNVQGCNNSADILEATETLSINQDALINKNIPASTQLPLRQEVLLNTNTSSANNTDARAYMKRKGLPCDENLASLTKVRKRIDKVTAPPPLSLLNNVDLTKEDGENDTNNTHSEGLPMDAKPEQNLNASILGANHAGSAANAKQILSGDVKSDICKRKQKRGWTRGKPRGSKMPKKAAEAYTAFHKNSVTMPISKTSSSTEHNYNIGVANLPPFWQSQLPTLYPPHFANQLVPLNVFPVAPLNAVTSSVAPDFLTPDLTQDMELEKSSSTPSLPDSLRGVFDTDDLREILGMEKIVYRLSEPHVHALAAVLNLSLDYLCGVLEKIVKLNVKGLHKIELAQNLLSEEAKGDASKLRLIDAPETSSRTVNNSPNAMSVRHFPSQMTAK